MPGRGPAISSCSICQICQIWTCQAAVEGLLQNMDLRTIFAACESAGSHGGTRPAGPTVDSEDWVGKRSGAVNMGGRRQRHPSGPSLPAEVGAPPPRTAPWRGHAAGRAGHRPCPRTRTSRQTCAPGSSRWAHLASATCAAQSCRRIGHGLVNQSSRW